MPTHQVYAEWLFLDCVSICTMERIGMVLLPRLSIFGTAGVMFHISSVIGNGSTNIYLMLLVLLAATVSLAVIVHESLAGTDVDLIYWLIIPVCQLAVILAMTTVIVYRAVYSPREPLWAHRLGLRLNPETAIAAQNFARTPPLWMQLVQNMDGLFETSPRFLQVSGHLVDTLNGDLTAISDTDTASAFVIEATADQGEALELHRGDNTFNLRTIQGLPVKAIVNRISPNGGSPISSLNLLMMSLRRVTNKAREQEEHTPSFTLKFVELTLEAF